MTNQSITAFETNGNDWWATNTSSASLAQITTIQKACNITKISSTEVDLVYQTQKVIVQGNFNLSLINGTPITLWDLNNIYTNFNASALISSLIITDTASPYAQENFFNVSVPWQDLMSFTFNQNQAVFNNFLSGNDIYFSGTTGAVTGNNYSAHLYGGNNIFVDSDRYASPTAYSDYFYGGSGVNTVILPGNSSNYKITASNSIWNDMTQTSNLSGFVITDNTKTINTLGVSSITYAQFADKTIKLSDMSVATSTVATTHSAVYMGNSDSVKILDSGTTVYGGKGNEVLTIAAYDSTNSIPFSTSISNVTVDQNVGQLNFDLPSYFYQFQQAGNTIKVYNSTGANLVLSAPVQGDSDGTLFSFADGTGSAILVAGKMTLGGALVSASQPISVTPSLIPNKIGQGSPFSTTSQVYMAANDYVTAGTSFETVFGNSGYEKVSLASIDLTGFASVLNVTLDQNIDEMVFGRSLSTYLFKQTGNIINIYKSIGLAASIPVQNDADGTVFTFTDGTASAKLVNGVMTLGGVAVSSVAPTAVSIPGFTTTVNVDGSQITLDGSAGNTSFVVAPGTFNVTISGFKATDHISFANNSLVSVSNPSYTDGSVTLQYSSGGQTEKVILIGLSGVQDAGINSATDLNTVFGTGTLV